MTETIRFTINGKPMTVGVDSDRMLLWVLRTDLGLTGTKYGCGQGHCGACTVLLNQQAVRSCIVPIKTVQGQQVMTIEGLAANGQPHPLQQAFMDHDALQCGFCTPGMILTAYSVLQSNPEPSESEIIKGMDRNLCRCGAHTRIIQAIQTAAAVMKGGRTL